MPQTERNGNWRWAFESAIRESALTPDARLAALTLSTRARRTSARWTLKADTLRAETGMGRNRVFAALRELEAGGYLMRYRRRTRTGWGANEYELTIPDPG